MVNLSTRPGNSASTYLDPELKTQTFLQICVIFSFCGEGHRKLVTDVFSFIFFLFSFFSILVECKETNQFAVIQCRWLFNCTVVHSSLYTVDCTGVHSSLYTVDCTGVHSSLYTVDCTRVLEQPGMNIFSYVLVQGWKFSSTLKTNASSTESVVAISPCFYLKI